MKDKKKILDKIKGKKSKASNYSLDDTIISEDPFDIFYNNSPMTCQDIELSDEDTLECGNEVEISKIIESSAVNKPSVVNITNHSINNLNYSQDKDFLAALIKPKEAVKKTTVLEPQIINQVVIYTSSDISFKPVSMYKYPYSADIKYEEGSLFESIYRLFISSLLKIYNSRQEFILKYRNEVLVFKKDVLKATLGLKRLLDNNDIEYEKFDYLIIKGVNISLVVDHLLNEPLTSTYVIPLIISKFRFINGIYYEIDIKKSKRAIKDNQNIVYEYTLEGPIYNIEYKGYFEYKHKIS
ncbi:hypothetical protein P3W45_000509 [Vairimorpha bombi]|jgi:hypothetical protein